MKSFYTVALASITALASANKAIMYESANCTGSTFEWNLQGNSLEQRRNYWDILGNGWNDRGQSVMVPVGYTLRLSEHDLEGTFMDGDYLDFEGRANADGSLVCQDLGAFKNYVSDSLYSINLASLLERQNQIINANASEIASLTNQINKLDSEIDVLDAEQVIEEHFYSNNDYLHFDGWTNNRDQCFAPFKVSAGQTVDFDANATLLDVTAPNNTTAMGRLFLVKNDGERVAQSRFSTRDMWVSIGAALNYREKLDADATYTLCLTWSDQSDVITKFQSNMFNWGYKIRGAEYNLTSHDFTAGDLTEGSIDAYWP